MIIDVFPFFNEYELLKKRCELLKGIVDLHVAVMGTHTYQGQMAHGLESYAPSAPHLEYRTVYTGLEPTYDAWNRERYHRQMIREEVANFASDDDIIIYTDADEIPNPEMVYVFPYGSGIRALEMRTFYYGTQWEDPFPTDRGKVFTWEEARNLDWNDLRWESPRYGSDNPVIPNAGWHISYYGGNDRIKTKLKSFSHTEYSDDRSIRRIQRGSSTGKGPNNERLVAVDPATLPDLLRGL